jgi:hypothetical protein
VGHASVSAWKAGSPLRGAPLDSTCRRHCLCACTLQAFGPGCMSYARRLCGKCPAEQMRALLPASSAGCVCARKEGTVDGNWHFAPWRGAGAVSIAETAEAGAELSGRRGRRAPPRVRAHRAARLGSGQCVLPKGGWGGQLRRAAGPRARRRRTSSTAATWTWTTSSRSRA